MVDRIKELCKEKGITIAELERSCGIGNGIIARWKKSKPSYERVAKVANFLEVTPEYLLNGEKEKTAPITGSGLSAEHQKLLELFERCNDNQKRLLLEMAQMMSEKKGE